MGWPPASPKSVWVEQVEVTRPSLHEKPDDRLGAGCVMSRLRAQRRSSGLGSIAKSAAPSLLAREPVQSQATQACDPAS